MRFAVLGSGSRGNATLIESRGSRVLVDCGFALREIERRLADIEVAAASIGAIVVTHEHSDHVTGVARLATRHGIEVWTSPGTWKGAGAPEVPGLRLFNGHGRGFGIGDLRFRPIPVPHDAREPCQFTVEGDGRRLGILTDTGCLTARIREHLRECDSLILETNHDPHLLRDGPYPPSVQRRIAGPFGHLSNQQAAEVLDAVNHRGLRRVLLSHISARNNRAELALEAVRGVDSGIDAAFLVAEQDRATGWLEV
ncbi:MBL fold metallo-hydrolase [Thiohalocapsa marina]|uniref:MBL fold metallo-hydrolase n=1 Tax=Thiohalocapsa marina TaxID=424902 RepID=A0A5M8FRW5_9GAMM|nr:MBL fold metallo-hydrolase [Thiohalocapsa marina]KAA6185845.1 MBL fold metallo-hydrolase [Thiohalocapsa marina]